jgi:hypothetical protein
MKCVKCSLDKQESDFTLRKGRTNRDTSCKRCRTEYVKQYKQDIKLGNRIKICKNPVIDNRVVCIKCNLSKECNQFQFRNDNQTYRNTCKDCKRSEMSVYYENVYNEIRRDKRKNNIQERLKNNHRNYIYKHLTIKRKKKKSSLLYVGCDFKMLKNWIEYQFDLEMSWENYGTLWTLDHVLPLSKFDLTDDTETRIAFGKICSHVSIIL